MNIINEFLVQHLRDILQHAIHACNRNAQDHTTVNMFDILLALNSDIPVNKVPKVASRLCSLQGYRVGDFNIRFVQEGHASDTGSSREGDLIVIRTRHAATSQPAYTYTSKLTDLEMSVVCNIIHCQALDDLDGVMAPRQVYTINGLCELMRTHRISITPKAVDKVISHLIKIGTFEFEKDVIKPRNTRYLHYTSSSYRQLEVHNGRS